MTTATSSAVVAPIAMIFAVNDDLVSRALDGLTPQELWQAPTERNNAMLWIAGHVVQTRATVLKLLGEDVDTGWGNLFERGATVGAADRYPSRESIDHMRREVGPRLLAKLASLDEEYLASPATMAVPGVKTVADQLGFFALHDTYHVGQLAYIRKALGYPGLAG
jgi:uncharacterized damage-inducible protein DinB